MTEAAEQSADPLSIRVMIVDDHEVFSSSLATVLEAEPDLTVVGVAATAAQAVATASSVQPDVVLLDHRLPDGDGIALIEPLLALDPAPQVVMLTASTADHVLIAAIEAGAAGFVDKSRSLGEVMSSVRSAAAGEASVSPAMLARLLPRLRRRATDPSWSLTERERQVLNQLGKGLSNAEIARQMYVSVHTVRNHVANLSAKLGAHSKLEVLSIAVREGLINS